MKLRTFALMCMCLSFMARAEAQINVNPDPRGEPWWVSDKDITDEERSEYDDLPLLVPTAQSLQTQLPSVVDNTQKPYWRGIFRQEGASCSQATGVGYVFTYMINRDRGLAANTDENRYSSNNTWCTDL